MTDWQRPRILPCRPVIEVIQCMRLVPSIQNLKSKIRNRVREVSEGIGLLPERILQRQDDDPGAAQSAEVLDGRKRPIGRYDHRDREPAPGAGAVATEDRG